MHGRPRQAISLCLFLIVAASLQAQTMDPPSEVWLSAKVRDFKEANTIDPTNTHPHFNTYNGCSAYEMNAATVEDDLDMGQSADGGLFAGDVRGPRLRGDMPSALARCFAPADRFSDWFQDRGPDVNRAFQVDLRFVRDPATGLYLHQSPSFFPLDKGGPYRKFNAADPDPFGHLHTGMLDGKDLSAHNYGFTMEFHTRVVYEAGKGHRLTFQGDDDIWVFMNGKKVVDLGGVHQTQVITVDMDSLAAVTGMQNGVDYPLDFYFAERHTASSSFRITANLHIPSTKVRTFASRAPSLKLAAGTPVAVYDRGGRLVRELRAEGSASFDFARVWDGKDSSGRPAAPGMYLWKAQSAGAPVSGWVMNHGGR